MARGRRGDRMSVNGEINVVSLIDVMMLLMVIFMITAPIMQGGVDVALPRGDVKPLEPKGGLVITIRSNGSIYIDDKRFTLSEFSGSIKALADKKGRDGVYVRADSLANYGDVLRVIAAAVAGGVTDVGLVAEPEKK